MLRSTIQKVSFWSDIEGNWNYLEKLVQLSKGISWKSTQQLHIQDDHGLVCFFKHTSICSLIDNWVFLCRLWEEILGIREHIH